MPMICETCEQPFADGAVKVFQGKKVCPGCFQTLTTSTVPKDNQHLQIIQTQHVRTTVCPECSAELHIDARTCLKCGAKVKMLDRAILTTGRIVVGILVGIPRVVLFTLPFVFVGGMVAAIAEGLHTHDTPSIVIGLALGGLAVFLYRRNGRTMQWYNNFLGSRNITAFLQGTRRNRG